MSVVPLVYLDQKASDLCLRVVDTPVDSAAFRVLKTGHLDWGSFYFTARIIGASHILSFGSADAELHEIFACKAAIPQGDQLVHQQLDSLTEPVQLDMGLFNYMFRVSREHAGSEKLHILESKTQSSELGLVFEFPRQSDEKPPRTIVVAGWNDDHTQIEVETAHSYPADDTVIFTHSRFTSSGYSL